MSGFREWARGLPLPLRRVWVWLYDHAWRLVRDQGRHQRRNKKS